MTQKEFDGAVDCLNLRLLNGCWLSFVDRLMDWMIEHDIEPTLAEDMLTDSLREIDERGLARFLVQRALARIEKKAAEEVTIQ